MLRRTKYLFEAGSDDLNVLKRRIRIRSKKCVDLQHLSANKKMGLEKTTLLSRR